LIIQYNSIQKKETGGGGSAIPMVFTITGIVAPIIIHLNNNEVTNEDIIISII
jgi:hypothetical protein